MASNHRTGAAPAALLPALVLVSALAVPAGVDAAYTGRVSVGVGGLEANQDSTTIALSADGRQVAFWSNGSNLPGGWGLFVRDRLAATTVRVGGFGGPYGDLAATPDLRFFAHATSTSVLVFDRSSSSDTLACANDSAFFSSNVAITDDGVEVAFQSVDDDLVPGDGNHAADVFVCSGGVVERVSEAGGGGDANALSLRPAISADGQYVAFYSRASNLVGAPTSGLWDAFVRDRSTDTTELVSVLPDDSAPGTETCCGGLDITPDGRFVAFSASPDGGSSYQIFVRDRLLGETELVSVPQSGAPVGIAGGISISDDGRFVVFSSNAGNLVAGDTNLAPDVFLRDRTLGSTTRVSVSSSGAETGAAFTSSSGGLISADGMIVAFTSSAADVVTGDTNESTDAFVHDRRCGNGALEGDEECDDGDHDSGDGCDADCTATACGNGTVTAGEACDAGGDNDADGCCTGSCTLVDVDSDGQCDAVDACNGPAMVRPGLVLRGAALIGANDTLTFRGKAPLSAPIDPLVDGVRLLLRDALGRMVLDVPIAGGGPWSQIAPNNWRYFDSAPPLGTATIAISVRGDTARVKIRGEGGEYASSPISPPLDAVLFFSALGGPCVQAHPACVVRAQGDKLVCR